MQIIQKPSGKRLPEKNSGIRWKINYYISSLPLDVELFARTVRGHWLVEVMHWHLDVTFREMKIA